MLKKVILFLAVLLCACMIHAMESLIKSMETMTLPTKATVYNVAGTSNMWDKVYNYLKKIWIMQQEYSQQKTTIEFYLDQYKLDIYLYQDSNKQKKENVLETIFINPKNLFNILNAWLPQHNMVVFELDGFNGFDHELYVEYYNIIVKKRSQQFSFKKALWNWKIILQNPLPI